MQGIEGYPMPCTCFDITNKESDLIDNESDRSLLLKL